MKYFYYVSRSKVEMLAPQLRRPKFSFKLSPKVAVAGVSIGADIERRDDSALIKQLDEVLQGLEKKKLVREIHDGIALDDGSFVHSNSIWRHGLFYFKGGVPGFGTSIHEQERTFITSVIYVAWTTFGGAIIILVGSPNNILGDKVAPEGVFVPGTSGVEDAVRDVVASFETDEPNNITSS